MIFVDSSAWFSMYVPSDIDHNAAVEWDIRNERASLVTTDYIIDETLTLLRARNCPVSATKLGTEFFCDTLCRIEWATQSDIREAWSIFRDFSDKAWSFTDCVSKVVMERLGITTAFSFDKHFRQFGGIEVVP